MLGAIVPKTTAEFIAAEFHAAYEELAPEHGYETRKESAVPWEQVPEQNRRLMQAVVGRLFKNGVITPGPIARQAAEYRANPPTPREAELSEAAQNRHPGD
jgi:hypothetical protein